MGLAWRGAAASELVRFTNEHGASLIVEVPEEAFGMERVSRDDAGVVQATQNLETAVAAARPAIHSIIESIRALAPEEYEVQFGIKLNAEAGVVVAKTSLEGHFDVTLRWRAPRTDQGGADA